MQRKTQQGFREYAVSSYQQDPRAIGLTQLYTPYRESVPNNPLVAQRDMSGALRQSPPLEKIYGDGVVEQRPPSIGFQAPLPRTYSRNMSAYVPPFALDSLPGDYGAKLAAQGRSPAEGGIPMDRSINPAYIAPSPLTQPPPQSVMQGLSNLAAVANRRPDAFVSVVGTPLHAHAVEGARMQQYYETMGAGYRPMMAPTDLGVLAAAAPPPTLPARQESSQQQGRG